MDGVLAEGTITAADLVGPLAGHPLSDLIDAIQAGNAYVNVHTNDGVAPTNTGPGDFPGGEIRGQLEHAQPRLRHGWPQRVFRLSAAIDGFNRSPRRISRDTRVLRRVTPLGAARFSDVFKRVHLSQPLGKTIEREEQQPCNV